MNKLNKDILRNLIKETLEEQAGSKIYLATAFLGNKPTIVGFSLTAEGAQKIANEVVKASGNINPLRIPSQFAVDVDTPVDFERDILSIMKSAAKKVKE